MSKTSVRKAIAEFDAQELRSLIFDLYARSKEAKEILDFYAEPDIDKLLEKIEKPLARELSRTSRGYYRARPSKIRAYFKKLAALEAGLDAEVKLQMFCLSYLCPQVASDRLNESLLGYALGMLQETIANIITLGEQDTYFPQLLRIGDDVAKTERYGHSLRGKIVKDIAEAESREE